MLYVDARGNYVAQRGFDHRSGTAIPVPPAVFPVIGSLKLDAARADPVSGLVRIDDGLFLITSRPILTSEVQGPFRGRLILGRRFDQTEMDHLGRITSLKVRLLDASDRSAASPRVTLNEGSVTGPISTTSLVGRSPHSKSAGRVNFSIGAPKPADSSFSTSRSRSSASSRS